MDLQAYYNELLPRFKKIVEIRGQEEFVKQQKRNHGMESAADFAFLFKENDIAAAVHPAVIKNLPHRHDFFEFIYVHRGCCMNRVDDEGVTMKEGDICLLNTNATHVLLPTRPEYDTIFNLLVRCSVMEKFHFKTLSCHDFIASFFLESMQKQRSEKNYVLFKKQEAGDNTQIDLFRLILQEALSKQTDRDVMLIYLFDALMVALTRCYQQQADQKFLKAKGRKNLTEMLTYLSQNMDTVTLESMSEEFSYHPQHLSKIIKQNFGMNFHTLLTSIRMEQACSMLKDQSLPVADIIKNVGYANHTWFNKCFKERYGKTPAQYRQEFLRPL